MDIRFYSGTMTMYFSGEFEEELQEEAQVYSQVCLWQEALLEELSNLCDVETWNEKNKNFLCKYIDELDLASLKLCIAYYENKLSFPLKIKSTWKEDKIFRKLNKTKFPCIMKGEVFLPFSFDFQFTFSNVDEEPSLYGSIYTLQKECEKLFSILGFDRNQLESYLKNESQLPIDKARKALAQCDQVISHALTHHTCVWIDC